MFKPYKRKRTTKKRRPKGVDDGSFWHDNLPDLSKAIGTSIKGHIEWAAEYFGCAKDTISIRGYRKGEDPQNPRTMFISIRSTAHSRGLTWMEHF